MVKYAACMIFLFISAVVTICSRFCCRTFTVVFHILYNWYCATIPQLCSGFCDIFTWFCTCHILAAVVQLGGCSRLMFSAAHRILTQVWKLLYCRGNEPSCIIEGFPWKLSGSGDTVQNKCIHLAVYYPQLDKKRN